MFSYCIQAHLHSLYKWRYLVYYYGTQIDCRSLDASADMATTCAICNDLPQHLTVNKSDQQEKKRYTLLKAKKRTYLPLRSVCS